MSIAIMSIRAEKCPLAQILLILGKLLSMIIYKKISQKERKFVNAESSESKSQLDFEHCFGIGLYLVDDCSEIKPSIGKNDS